MTCMAPTQMGMRSDDMHMPSVLRMLDCPAIMYQRVVWLFPVHFTVMLSHVILLFPNHYFVETMVSLSCTDESLSVGNSCTQIVDCFVFQTVPALLAGGSGCTAGHIFMALTALLE